MSYLRDKALAFLRSPRCVREDEPTPSREELIKQYLSGEYKTDPKFLDHVSRALEHARANAVVPDGDVGPARDAAYVYQRIARILEGIQAEVSAEQ